jgi:hypothetical protein
MEFHSSLVLARTTTIAISWFSLLSLSALVLVLLLLCGSKFEKDGRRFFSYLNCT